MANARRLPLVGIIGGEDRSGCARLVGRELVKYGFVILTGGRAIDGNIATKNTAIMGMLDAERCGEGFARYIGVLPNASGGTLHYEQVSKGQLLIHTGLSSMDRDPINGITPDALVCFAGGPGTLCELTFGIVAGRKIVFHNNSADTLLRQCIGSQKREVERNILRVVAHWQSHLKLSIEKSSQIMDIVVKYLREASSRKKLSSAQEIVQAVLEALPNQLPDIPAFPGIPGGRHPQQIEKFASWWKVLSKPVEQSQTSHCCSPRNGLKEIQSN